MDGHPIAGRNTNHAAWLECSSCQDVFGIALPEAQCSPAYRLHGVTLYPAAICPPRRSPGYARPGDLLAGCPISVHTYDNRRHLRDGGERATYRRLTNTEAQPYDPLKTGRTAAYSEFAATKRQRCTLWYWYSPVALTWILTASADPRPCCSEGQSQSLADSALPAGAAHPYPTN